MTDNVTTRSADSSHEPRTAYVPPRLVVYGSLVDITRAVGPRSNKDGGAVVGMMMSQ